MNRRLLLKLLASGTALTAAPASVWAQMKGETSPRKYEWRFPEKPSPLGSGGTGYGSGVLEVAGLFR